MSIRLITPPATEPITLNEAKLQCGFGPMQDSDRAASQILNEKLRAFVVTAREACENYINRVFITQRWQIVLDGFPGYSTRYERNGYPEIRLPKPPFQSVESFQYIDTAGVVQDLVLDASYGTDPNPPTWAYQLERGSETQPGRLISAYPRYFPPTRLVPGNVIVKFRCGYGCPISVTTAENSTTLTLLAGSIFGSGFNADDAPVMAGDTGLPISIPEAGAAGSTLNTFIAAVDLDGNATLQDEAAVAVTSQPAWAGAKVPDVIRNAIKVTVESYYDLGYASDDIPDGAKNMLKPYLNWTA